MSVNRKAVVIYGSTDLWIYWDKADKLRLFYRDISHNLRAKRVFQSTGATRPLVSMVTISSKLGALNMENCPEFGILN